LPERARRRERQTKSCERLYDYYRHAKEIDAKGKRDRQTDREAGMEGREKERGLVGREREREKKSRKRGNSESRVGRLPVNSSFIHCLFYTGGPLYAPQK